MEHVPWNVFTLVLSAVIGVYSFITSRASAQREQVAEVEQKHATLSERVRHMPTAHEVSDLTVAVRALTVEMSWLRDKLSGLENRVGMHDEVEFRREGPTR